MKKKSLKKVKKSKNKIQFTISRDTPIYDISQFKPKAAEFLIEHYNFYCVGCPLAFFETLEQGARLHGLTDEEIDRLVEKLNEIN